MKKRICVLEDDHDIRSVLKMILSAEDYDVSLYSNIRDLVRARNNCLPDLYLLDIMLPDGNGLDFCRKIKNDQHTRHIPVIMMSANVPSSQIGISCKARAFVEKPFDIDHIIELIRFAMGDKSGAEDHHEN